VRGDRKQRVIQKMAELPKEESFVYSAFLLSSLKEKEKGQRNTGKYIEPVTGMGSYGALT